MRGLLRHFLVSCEVNLRLQALVLVSLCCVFPGAGCSPQARGDGDGAQATDRHVAGKSIVNTIGMEFSYIPAGEFTMGTADEGFPEHVPELFRRIEKPHGVQIKEGFFIQSTEVTNQQFQKFVAATEYDGGAQGEELLRHLRDAEYSDFRGAGKPVVFVSMHDATAFAEWLGKEEGRVYRLPTEEEWEYACKAGCASAGQSADLAEHAWYDPNSQGHPHEVGQKTANPWGIHDMLGNVWEWTSSSFSKDMAEKSSLGSDVRHIRGGSFSNHSCRCAARWAGFPPTTRSDSVGFRLVLECDVNVCGSHEVHYEPKR
jgi:formylglycine-generating enzyme required for sulfatase activity